LTTLNASSTLNGWYYDRVNSLLCVKFKTKSAVVLEVVQPSGPLPNEPPTALFAWTPSQPKVNEEVVFDASLSYDDGTITSYEWEFGDGTQITVATPGTNHVYSATGDFAVALKVTDNEGFTDTVSNVLRVSAASEEPPTQQPNNSTWILVSVIVKDASTSTPIQASVSLRNSTWASANQTTNVYGWTEFSGLQSGTYRITGSSEGYTTKEENVTITSNVTYTLSLTKESTVGGDIFAALTTYALLLLSSIVAIVIILGTLVIKAKRSNI